MVPAVSEQHTAAVCTSSLKKEAVCSSGMLLTTYQTARYLMQECGENRKRSNISCYHESCKWENGGVTPLPRRNPRNWSCPFACRDGIWRSGVTVPLVQWVEVSGQLEALASSSLAKECRFKWKVGGPQSQSLCIGVEEILFITVPLIRILIG
jgi:hypothetical protein